MNPRGIRVTTFAVAFAAVSLASSVQADDEVSLFDADGKATAYIAADDELTLYIWRGKPVAYLASDSTGGYHVYGFNGKHLGWFVQGVIWDHEGGGSCAVKQRLQYAQFEPFKGFKEFRPFKGFGSTPCLLLLMAGAAS